jgi:hypothetical protein
VLINIGDIAADCPQCGGAEFQAPSDGPLRLTTELKCTACGGNVKYLLLLDRIGEEAMRRANKSLDELRKQPKK